MIYNFIRQTLFNMITNSYVIAFDLSLERANIVVPLVADVALHHSQPYYIVSNFRKENHQEVVMPKLEIMRKYGSWVHRDSEKESHLSVRKRNKIGFTGRLVTAS